MAKVLDSFRRVEHWCAWLCSLMSLIPHRCFLSILQHAIWCIVASSYINCHSFADYRATITASPHAYEQIYVEIEKVTEK